MKKSPLKSPKNFSTTVNGMSGVCTQSNVSACSLRRKAAAKTFRQLSPENSACAPARAVWRGRGDFLIQRRMVHAFLIEIAERIHYGFLILLIGYAKPAVVGF